MFSMILIVPILIIILIIFIITGIRAGINGNPEEGDGENMIKNVYIYLVLFATLMMTIGGSVGAFMAAADIIAPVPYHQTFEEFKRWNGSDKPAIDKDRLAENQLSEEELKANYDAMILSEKERQISRAKNNLVKSFGWIIIPLPVFIYYQRRLSQKETQNY